MRPVAELVVLAIVGTVCGAVLLCTIVIGVLALAQPDRDLSQPVAAIANTYSILLGLLAGYLTGRARSNGSSRRGPEPDRGDRSDVDRGRGSDRDPGHG